MLGHRDVIRALLDYGADPHIPNKNGRTPLHLACKENGSAALRMLLEYGADLSICDRDGLTALHIASKYGCLEVMRLLLDHGADPCVGDNTGSTALHRAARYGKHEAVRLLLDHGGVELACIRDKYGIMAVRYATSKGHVECANLLQSSSTPAPQHATRRGPSPTHFNHPT